MLRHSKGAPGALLLLSSLFCANLAGAAPSPSDRATARNLAQEGEAALVKNAFTTAVDRFSRADALVHAPTLLLELARAQIGLGKLVEAEAIFRRIVSEGVPAGSPKSWTKALEDATQAVDVVAARIPSVTIKVEGPAEAITTLDDVAVAPTTLGVKQPINPGAHTVRASVPG